MFHALLISSAFKISFNMIIEKVYFCYNFENDIIREKVYVTFNYALIVHCYVVNIRFLIVFNFLLK